MSKRLTKTKGFIVPYSINVSWEHEFFHKTILA